MTPAEIATKAVTWLLPFLKENKLIEEIANDFKDAAATELRLLWKKVKPIFIEDFNDGTGRLDAAAASAPAVRKVLEKTLKGDEPLATELRKLLAALDQKVAPGEISVKGSQNVVVNTGTITISNGGINVGNTKTGD